MTSRPLCIVLIEDSKGDARLTEEMLKETGIVHELTWLSNGELAVQYFENGGSADFVLLDLNLPLISGHQVLASLRASRLSEDRVIIVTGSNSLEDMERSSSNGVVHYIVKPMGVEEMERAAKTLREILLGERS